MIVCLSGKTTILMISPSTFFTIFWQNNCRKKTETQRSGLFCTPGCFKVQYWSLTVLQVADQHGSPTGSAQCVWQTTVNRWERNLTWRNRNGPAARITWEHGDASFFTLCRNCLLHLIAVHQEHPEVHSRIYRYDKQSSACWALLARANGRVDSCRPNISR